MGRNRNNEIWLSQNFESKKLKYASFENLFKKGRVFIKYLKIIYSKILNYFNVWKVCSKDFVTIKKRKVVSSKIDFDDVQGVWV